MCQHGVVHSISEIRDKEDIASTRGSTFNIRDQTLCQHGVVHSISGK